MDPWVLSSTSLHGSIAPAAPSAKSALLKRDYQTSWYMFSRSQQHFDQAMCSKLLAILPSGAHTASQWWPRARKIKSTMDRQAQRLSAADFAVLINLAARAGDSKTVRQLWLEMSDKRVVRDTNVWNQYIVAVCDANPDFWPWPRSRSLSVPTLHAELVAHAPAEAITDLLQRMELEGVPRDSRTYEIIVLAMARANPQNLALCRQIVQRIWLSGASTPGLSALTSIINSWGFHYQLRDGFALVQEVADSYSAGLGLGSIAAEQFWVRLLRLVVAQTEPRRGELPAGFFDDVFSLMTSKYGFAPTLGAWSIRIEHWEAKNQFDEMSRALPAILALSGGYELAQSAISRAVIGLANTNHAMDGVKALQKARALGVEPERDLEAYLAKRGATLNQVELFEEDDDEDMIGGF